MRNQDFPMYNAVSEIVSAASQMLELEEIASLLLELTCAVLNKRVLSAEFGGEAQGQTELWMFVFQADKAVLETRWKFPIRLAHRKKARPFKQKLATLVLAADSAGVDLTTICEALLLALVKLFPDDKDGAFIVGDVFFAEAQPRGLLHKYVHWHYRFTARRIAHLRSGKEVKL